MQIGRIDRVQIVRLARTGKVTMKCMIGATSKVHHVEIGKKQGLEQKELTISVWPWKESISFEGLFPR